MAAVKQRGKRKRKTWYAIFRDLNGKQKWVKLAAANRKDAQKAADVLENTAKRKKSFQHMRSAFNDLCQEAYGTGLPVSTARAFMAQWLAQKKPETAEASYRAYRKPSERFLEFLGQKADEDIANITRRDLVEFRNSLVSTQDPGTTNGYIKILRMAFKVAHREGYIIENPAEHVERVKKKKKQEGRRAFSLQEIQSVLAVADPEWRSLINFGLYTGQRLGDLALMTWSNVDPAQGVIRITARKTGKQRTIPIPAARRGLIARVTGSDSPSTPLHPRAFAMMQKPHGVSTLSNQFANLLAQVGLREKVSHEAQGIGRSAKRTQNALSFHSLRHTTVSMLKAAGIPQATVQELVGHDSEAMSALYTHVGIEALEKAAAALPEI